MNVITITKQQLRDALLVWEVQHRAGQTRSEDETKALPVSQVADESADALWCSLLAMKEAA